ncbi:hypothetical protein HK405_000038, partial [Cladochytrium tenue]
MAGRQPHDAAAAATSLIRALAVLVYLAATSAVGPPPVVPVTATTNLPVLMARNAALTGGLYRRIPSMPDYASSTDAAASTPTTTPAYYTATAAPSSSSWSPSRTASIHSNSCTTAPQPGPTIQGTCADGDYALTDLLSYGLSPFASVGCRGSDLQLYNQARYWGTQIGLPATAVVFPRTKEDVSAALVAAARGAGGGDVAVVGGAHGVTGAAASTGLVIDLSFLNATRIVTDVAAELGTVNARGIDADVLVAYQGGAIWSQVNAVTAGSGYAAVGARVGNVGVGGFSTGGGIGFLAGAYGYAVDRIVAAEVVLPSGEVVVATDANERADLLWARRGGGGQFGVVTTFYQAAVPEPTSVEMHVWTVADTPESQAAAMTNVACFFDENSDPFSVLYYAVGYIPVNASDPQSPYALQTVMAGVRFGDASNAAQPPFDTTFGHLLDGVAVTAEVTYTVPFSAAAELFASSFPYGLRRGFYGPQTTR